MSLSLTSSTSRVCSARAFSRFRAAGRGVFAAFAHAAACSGVFALLMESAWMDSISAPSALCTSRWRASGALPWNCWLTTETSKLDPQLWRRGGETSARSDGLSGRGRFRSGKESRRSGRDARRDVLSANVGDVHFRRLERGAQKVLDFLHGRHDLSSALGGVARCHRAFPFQRIKSRENKCQIWSRRTRRRAAREPPGGQAWLFAGSFRWARDVRWRDARGSAR